MRVAFVLLVAPRGWVCQSVDAVPMSTASVGTEHSALHFGVRNRIVLLTERDAERCVSSCGLHGCRESGLALLVLACTGLLAECRQDDMLQ